MYKDGIGWAKLEYTTLQSSSNVFIRNVTSCFFFEISQSYKIRKKAKMIGTPFFENLRKYIIQISKIQQLLTRKCVKRQILIDV